MVAGENFGSTAAGMVKEDEVFQKVDESFFFADAAKHGLQFHAAGVGFFEAFPFVEKFVFTAEGTDFGVMAVAQNEEGVVIKELRDGILIVGEVVGVGILNINIDRFELHKEQRDAVDKTDDIGAATVVVAVDFEFFDGEKMVVERILKIDEFGGAGGDFAIGEFYGNGDTVADEEIFFLIDLH